MPPDDLKPPVKRKVGFALMDPERRRELGRKGGTNAPKDKRPFAANRLLAREAGKKGGLRKGKGKGGYQGVPTTSYAIDNLRRVAEYKSLYTDPMHPSKRKIE